MQHSHSTHQKIISNLLRITLKGRLRVSNEQSLEGAIYVNKPMVLLLPFWGQISQNVDGFRQKQFTRLIEFIKFYKQNPLEIFFFTVDQYDTLALIFVHKCYISFKSYMYEPMCLEFLAWKCF